MIFFVKRSDINFQACEKSPQYQTFTTLVQNCLSWRKLPPQALKVSSYHCVVSVTVSLYKPPTSVKASVRLV